jgi:hypothetical protein
MRWTSHDECCSWSLDEMATKALDQRGKWKKQITWICNGFNILGALFYLVYLSAC